MSLTATVKTMSWNSVTSAQTLSIYFLSSFPGASWIEETQGTGAAVTTSYEKYFLLGFHWITSSAAAVRKIK